MQASRGGAARRACVIIVNERDHARRRRTHIMMYVYRDAVAPARRLAALPSK